jgi:ubiquinone/menaquinone biosynthesis C-methylase UbiE
MKRVAEPELMDLPDEVDAYAKADFAEVNERFVSRLLELAGSRRELRAVDLGTGPADIPIRVAKRRSKWKIVAADASGPMLKVARREIRKAGVSRQIKLLLTDAKKLALPDASFDVVFSNSILHHVKDPLQFWREVKRVSKPGALIFLRDLARPKTAAAAKEIVTKNAGNESDLLQEEFYRSLLAAYTLAEVRAQLKRAGLALNVAMASDRHLDAWGRKST